MGAKRLKDETSPYLQQHADNPVDWWPWCDEALDLARREDKPILLSIGYSACHWCHVMAHESFEDDDTAALMNSLFVNIKVDREERPDLDRIYQTAHQLLSQRPGGWPLTVFLTPDDHSPFFAGTYFPPQPRHGLLSFSELLGNVERAFREQRDAIDEQNTSLRDALKQIDATPPGGAPDALLIDAARQQLAAQFDTAHGGFGGAPKFPHPPTLRFLLREGARQDNAMARDMALRTLEQMANGGINDHIGGGFCRYSVDAQWMIPHFEKMLYDNGQLLGLYAEAWLASGARPLFKHVCERTAEWVMREMQSNDGGYYASLDADSEGEEGKYYLWTPAEVVALLDDPEYRVFALRFGLDRAANFEGRWHLHCFTETADIASKTGMGARDVRRLLRSARDKLLTERETRVRPARDEKILTSWSALMIKGMATAGRLLDRADWIDSASRAMDYLRTHHWRDQRLLATSRDGSARLNAYLDDYAFLADAGLALLQAHWDNDLMGFVQQLGERLLTHFEDREHGAFFFTSDDHETLVHRPKPLADDALPSGNGIAIEVLQSLALLSGELRFHDAAERALSAATGSARRAPHAHVGLLEGVRNSLSPGELLIMRGPAKELERWSRAALEHHVPERLLFAIDENVDGLPKGLADKQARPGHTLAYRCRGQVCEAPIDRLEQLTTSAAQTTE